MNQAITRRQLLAVCAGNALEFYEFLIYSTFAVYIGQSFFPAHNSSTSLLLSLATFGAGFITRPIGALVIGRVGDRFGRKPAMLFSLGLMAVGMAGLALTPGYRTIGNWAAGLVLTFRLIQGFALGGEVGPSTAYLIEAAATGRRGLIGSFQGATQGLAVLLAALIGFFLSLLMSEATLADWGWRLGMLPGLLVVPVSLAIRRNLPETLPRESHTLSSSPEKWRVPQLRLIICGLAMLGAGTISTYVGNYTTTYALTTLHMPANVSFFAGFVNGAMMLSLAPLLGALSDRTGRRPLLIFGLIAVTLVPVPAFEVIVHHPTPLTLYAMIALIGLATAPVTAPLYVALAEGFPPRQRAMAMSCLYAVAISLFGGSTQFVVAWLIQHLGDPVMPAYYRAGAAAIGLIAALALPETSPKRFRSREPSDLVSPLGV